MQPWPVAFTYWHRRRRPEPAPPDRPPDRRVDRDGPAGEVVEAEGDRLVVAAGGGPVRLLTVQLAGQEADGPPPTSCGATGSLPGDRMAARQARPLTTRDVPSIGRDWYNPVANAVASRCRRRSGPPIQEFTTMSPCRKSDLRKKLYIETVGCQMNLLDSELVVGKLRHEGYELTDDIDQADTILYNTCSVRQHAEDKIYSALGPDPAPQAAQARADDRRPRLHGAEGPGADPQAGARTSTWSSAPASSAGSPSCSSQAKEQQAPQMAVSLPADRRHARRPSPRASPSTTRSASRRCGRARSRRSSGS